MLSLLLAGAWGGVTRGLVGFIKYQSAKKQTKFETNYFLTMIILSSLVGVGISWVVAEVDGKILGLKEITPAIAFIVGYAGGDLLENLYKILLKKTTLYPPESASPFGELLKQPLEKS